MRKLLHSFVIVIICITACTGGNRQDNTYQDLNNIISESPLVVFDSIRGLMEGNSSFTQEQKCSLLVLMEKAKYKAYMNVTDSDAMILKKITGYFSERENREMLVESYFLLGYVLKCLHDTPSALETLLTAVKTAENIEGYDNPALMMRVYMEIQDLYSSLRMYDLFYVANKQVIKYAEECHDTMFLAYCYESRNAVFYLQEKYDSVLAGYPKVRYLYESTGNTARTAQSLFQYIMANILLGQCDSAKAGIMEMERNGNIFDANQKVFPQYSLYYYVKGMVCVLENNFDSAGYYFHKELDNIAADDINNRKGAFSGLMNLYDKTGNVDSAYKYSRALMSIRVTDYDKGVSDQLTEMQSIYDYSRQQAIAKEKAYQNEILTRRNANLFLTFLLVVSVFLIIGYIVVQNFKSKRREQAVKEEELRIKLEEYKQNQACHERRLEELQNSLQESTIIASIHELDKKNKKIDGYTLAEILRYGKANYPTFFGEMVDKYRISENESIVFVLMKMKFKPSLVSRILSMSQSNVNNIMTRLYKKVNGKSVNTIQVIDWIWEVD